MFLLIILFYPYEHVVPILKCRMCYSFGYTVKSCRAKLGMETFVKTKYVSTALASTTLGMNLSYVIRMQNRDNKLIPDISNMTVFSFLSSLPNLTIILPGKKLLHSKINKLKYFISLQHSHDVCVLFEWINLHIDGVFNMSIPNCVVVEPRRKREGRCSNFSKQKYKIFTFISRRLFFLLDNWIFSIKNQNFNRYNFVYYQSGSFYCTQFVKGFSFNWLSRRYSY